LELPREALIKFGRKAWTTEDTGVHGGSRGLIRGFLGPFDLSQGKLFGAQKGGPKDGNAGLKPGSISEHFTRR